MTTEKMIRMDRYKSTKDSKGDFKETVDLRVTAWAEVSRSGGDRSSLNGQEGLTNFFLFRVKFNPKFNPTGNWRVIYDGRRFTVHSIEKEEQRRFHWIIKGEAQGKR